MKKLIGNTLLFIFILGQIAACQNPKKMTAEEQTKSDQEELNRPSEIWPTNKDKKGDYYYSVSLNSFPGYLSENAGSYFIAGNERVAFLTMENGEWTKTTGAVLNDEYHPVPDSLFVSWFSISENKFYEGTFKMPAELLKKYFDEMWLTYGSSNKKRLASKHERFKDLIAGVTPGGGVMVWIKSRGQQIEIGHYQAKETQMDWSKFAGLNGFGAGTTRQGFVSARKEDITLPVPFGKAEKYREKFVWKCDVEAKADVKPLNYQIYMFDGEIESVYRDYKAGTNEMLKRAVPARLNFLLQEKNGKAYNFEIHFGEAEIFKAFQTICKDKTTEAKLVLELNKDNDISKIVLRNKTHEYVLNPAKVNLFLGEFNANILPLKEN